MASCGHPAHKAEPLSPERSASAPLGDSWDWPQREVGEGTATGAAAGAPSSLLPQSGVERRGPGQNGGAGRAGAELLAG